MLRLTSLAGIASINVFTFLTDKISRKAKYCQKTEGFFHLVACIDINSTIKIGF